MQTVIITIQLLYDFQWITSDVHCPKQSDYLFYKYNHIFSHDIIEHDNNKCTSTKPHKEEYNFLVVVFVYWFQKMLRILSQCILMLKIRVPTSLT